MLSPHGEIAQRLKAVVDDLGGVTVAAKKLGMNSSEALSPYLSGRRIPGNKLRGRIREVCGEKTELHVMYGDTLERASKEHERRRGILEAAERHGYRDGQSLDGALIAYEKLKGIVLNDAQPGYKLKGKKT